MRRAAQTTRPQTTTRPLAITVAVTASLALAGCSLGTDDAAEETGGTTEASDSGDQPSGDQPSGSAASSGRGSRCHDHRQALPLARAHPRPHLPIPAPPRGQDTQTARP